MKHTKGIAVLAALLCLVTVPAPTGSHADSFPAYSGNEWAMLKIVNLNRINAGMLPLTMTAKLQQAADIRVGELKSEYSHKRPNGKPYTTVFDQVGLNIIYGNWGENISGGSADASSIMIGWMNSPGHKANILDGVFVHIGIGYDAPYWVQLFLNANGCSANGFSLDVPNTTLMYDENTKIEDFNIIAVVDCSAHGASYMPLISEMCTGFDPAINAVQTVTAHYNNLSATFTVYPKSLKISLPLPPRFSPIELPVWVWAKVTPKPWQPVKTLGPQPTPSATAPGPSPAPTPLETEAVLPQRDERFPVIEVVPFFSLASPQPTVGID